MAKVLVVDDSADITSVVSTILSAREHKVVIATDGRKALEMMATELPDLVVLDVMMPEMDGFMVLKQMRVGGLKEATKVLMLTGRSAESDWVRGYKLGADSYLTKPFDPDELMREVDEILDMSRDELRTRREEELARAQMLARLESIF